MPPFLPNGALRSFASGWLARLKAPEWTVPQVVRKELSSCVTVSAGKASVSFGGDPRPPRPKKPIVRKLLKWVCVGAVAGTTAAFFFTVFVPDVREIRDSEHYYSNWKIRAYCSLPLNVSSRMAGVFANVPIPKCLRSHLFGMFVKTYGCRMDEALVEDLTAYPTFAAFFNRNLKPIIRPISAASLVSPADGILVHFGKIRDGRIEFVKGYDYHYSEFLGSKNVDLKNRSGTDLYQMVIYLAPGNYHSFHSPAHWDAEYEVHFPGLLLSVRPSLLLGQLPKLLCSNERVVLSGRWKHGFFSMSLVAATNVGSIAIDADPNLRTNLKGRRRKGSFPQATVVDLKHEYTPGEKVGEFRLGSTVVLVFEAPSSLEFTVKAGDRLRYGQSLVHGRI